MPLGLSDIVPRLFQIVDKVRTVIERQKGGCLYSKPVLYIATLI
jgi:hypothetical protein